MKIIFSPSKSQYPDSAVQNETSLIFPEKTQYLIDCLQKFSVKDFVKTYGVSEKIAQHTYQQYKDFYKQMTSSSLELFSGTAFRQLTFSGYGQAEFDYIQEHLCILSALYGVILGGQTIYPYRLDMTQKVLEEHEQHRNLYDFWKDELEAYFADEKVIVNLASLEYAKMIPEKYHNNIVRVHFVIVIENQEKTVSFEVKKQRGKLLDFMINSKIENLNDLRKYDSDGYVYNPQKSNKNNIFFIKHL